MEVNRCPKNLCFTDSKALRAADLAWRFGVLRSGVDTKWSQLNRILDDDLMVDSAGNRRKLIIFTEPKDTLHYLLDKVRARLGNPEAVTAHLNRRRRTANTFRLFAVCSSGIRSKTATTSDLVMVGKGLLPRTGLR